MDAPTPTNTDNAEKEKPKGFWNAVFTTLPIVLAIVATGFAGMSSSEMTQSMYYRSLAAQHQSKAGDQWGFFQAKRIRGTSLEMTVDLLQSESFDPAELKETVDAIARSLSVPVLGVKKEDIGKIKEIGTQLTKLLSDEKTKQSLTYLTTSALPKIEEKKPTKPEVQKAIDNVIKEIGQRKTETETAKSIRALDPADVDEAILLTEQNADSFDKACEPIAETIKEFRNILKELDAAVKSAINDVASPAGIRPTLAVLTKKFKSSELDFNARRYQQESYYNRKAAEVYEIRVRRSGVESDIHREHSKMFFYCMLIAQVGVMVSSLALGRSQRGLLLCAVVFGLASLGFGGYVSLAL